MSASPEVVKALHQIAEANNGTLTPDAVVATARNPKSVLHDFFTWDDSIAAQQYRNEQARSLIRSVRIEFKTETRVYSSVGYVRDPELPNDEQGYTSITRLRNKPDAARDAICREFAMAAAALRRAREIATALGLKEEIDTMINRIVEMRENSNNTSSAA